MFQLSFESVRKRVAYKYSINSFSKNIGVFVVKLNDNEITLSRLPLRSRIDEDKYGSVFFDWYAHFILDSATQEAHLIQLSSWKMDMTPRFNISDDMEINHKSMNFPLENDLYRWYRANDGHCCYHLKINVKGDLDQLISQYAFEQMQRLQCKKERSPLDKLISKVLLSNLYKENKERALELLSGFTLLDCKT
ncbi:hypothetical protein ACMXYX_17670 (plasmid) [Neptuniibacter sp. QD72_48]|uniref:hypothetical protein n=1 Tax=Neptuniibacter sp. QD72_48 TaxID=3398214 RepID=UPI0039F5B344